MTYCVAVRLDTGMIFASDSRTNAGVDHIATFSKMRVYEKKDDRVIVVLSSGNLAMTQGVVAFAERTHITVVPEGVETPEEAAALQSAGVRHGQGNHFARPGSLVGVLRGRELA